MKFYHMPIDWLRRSISDCCGAAFPSMWRKELVPDFLLPETASHPSSKLSSPPESKLQTKRRRATPPPVARYHYKRCPHLPRVPLFLDLPAEMTVKYCATQVPRRCSAALGS